MTTGIITTAVIDNMTQTFIAKALETREHSPVMAMKGITDVKTLPNGYGLTYNEPYVGSLVATTLYDGVEFDSPSQFSDTNIQVVASFYGVQTLVTDLSNDQVKENLYAMAGRLMGRAMEYLRDTTGLTMLDGFGGSLGSGTATLTAGHISSAGSSIRAGLAQSGGSLRTGARATGDPAEGPINCIIHEYQYRALAAQMSGLFSGSSDGAIGTTAPTMNFATNRVGLSGWQQQWLTDHYRGATLDGIRIIADNNLTIASNATKSGVLARDALIHLKYRSPIRNTFKTPDGFAYKMTYAENWGWGERADAWGVELNVACVTPTS